MTETKRFTYGIRQGTTMYEIKDSYHEFPIVEPYYYESSAKKVCDLLNALHEENEQIRDVNAQCCNDYSAMRRDVLRYKEENEQLKQRITELELLNDGLNYALKNIRKIDVEIDVGGDVE